MYYLYTVPDKKKECELVFIDYGEPIKIINSFHKLLEKYESLEFNDTSNNTSNDTSDTTDWRIMIFNVKCEIQTQMKINNVIYRDLYPHENDKEYFEKQFQNRMLLR